MTTRNIWPPVFGIIGMLAWMLFILGCLQWSSWSPDSSKVLFPYANPEEKYMGIALYDRTARTVRPLLIQPSSEEGEQPVLQAQWASDGSTVIAILAEESDVDILLSSFQPGVPTQHVHLGKLDGQQLAPLPELDGSLYLADGKAILRVSLASGAVQRKISDGSPHRLLFTDRRELFYIGFTDAEKWPMEFGTIDPIDLSIHWLFEFSSNDYEPELLIPVVPQIAGERFAMVGKGKDKDAILVFTRYGFEKSINPQGLPDKFRFRNLQWSNDDVIYASMVTPTGEPFVRQYSVAEIWMKDGSGRATPLCQMKSKDKDDASLQYFVDVSLSPDGYTIATTPALLGPENIDEQDRALFLIDLKDADRQITKIPAPRSLSLSAAPANGG